MATEMMEEQKITVRELARLLGMMPASHPAILPAPLYCRHLERAKTRALQRGLPYEAEIQLDPNSRPDLHWWVTCPNHYNGRLLQITQWELDVESDASQKGWGASCQGISSGDPWTDQEKTHHINYLKLLAAFLVLKCFASNRRAASILLRLDNVTAIAFLNRMGGTHALYTLVQPGSGNMEVVPRPEYSDPCLAPPRIRERPGKLAVPARHRLQ